MARYLVGIDLGTTNSALAYIDLQAAKGRAARRRSTRSPCRSWWPRARWARGRCCRRFSTCRDRTTCRPAPPRCRGTRTESRGRRVCPQSRGSHSRPAGHLRQVVAMPCRRRSLGPAVAVERTARCSAHLARRGVGRLSAPPRRQLEPRHGPRPDDAPRETDRGADGAGVVRRRGPNADGGGGEEGGAGKCDAAGRAAGRVLLLAGDASAARRRPSSSRVTAAWWWTWAAAPAISA